MAGEAEAGLERLHQCAEKDLQTFLEGDTPITSFNDFRTKLAGLTRCSFSNIGNNVFKKWIANTIAHSLYLYISCYLLFEAHLHQASSAN